MPIRARPACCKADMASPPSCHLHWGHFHLGNISQVSSGDVFRDVRDVNSRDGVTWGRCEQEGHVQKEICLAVIEAIHAQTCIQIQQNVPCFYTKRPTDGSIGLGSREI